MIHIENLNKSFGDRILFEDVSWHVKKRDRIGLTGPNGSGKTTLLRMLAGSETPDSGVVRMASDTSVGYLPQDGIVHHGRAVREEVQMAFANLLALRHEQQTIEDSLADPSMTPDEQNLRLERYADLSDRFKDLGGWEMDARVSEVTRGLGFSPSDLERRTEEFSGGWQMRIALAKLLLSRPNLLLMDEPTNHLDLPARNWLEDYLSSYPGSIVLVSHDRYFLDATVARITEVGLRTLTDYHGNYSHYTVEHSARMERLQERHRRQTDELERANAFINKFRYQATKARQVQSRIKMLDKINLVEVPPERRRIRFRFPEAPRPGRVVLEAVNVRKAYGDNIVLEDSRLIVERSDRIGLVGPNGAGKTTLMRILAGVDAADCGQVHAGHRVVYEYFAQNQADTLDPARSVYEEMTAASPSTMVPMIRNILGGFLFSGDDIYKKVAVLSGGERNRLAIAKMLLRASNLLLLDEPTNHLDLDSKEILLEALLDYNGTIVFVSHDRHFVDRLATKIVEVGVGQTRLYPGGYEDFLEWKKNGSAALAPPSRSVDDVKKSDTFTLKDFSTVAPAAPLTRAPKKRLPVSNTAAAARDPMAPRLRPKNAPLDRQARLREARKIKIRLDAVEKDISERETALRDIERRMSDASFYDERARANETVAEYEALKIQLTELMSEWETLQAAFDTAAGR